MSNERAAPLGGLRLVVTATAIAGVGGYAITTVAAAGLGDSYAVFAIFWSALYLVVGALAGIQQEVTRGIRPPSGSASPIGRASVASLSVGAAVVVAAAVLATSPLWASAVFGRETQLVFPLAFGAAGYIFVAAATGIMYGVHLWKPLALAIVLDVLLRFVLIGVGLISDLDVTMLGWAVVLPFPLLTVILWIVAGRRLAASRMLDVGYRIAGANILRTVVAAAATAVLVSGFPLLLGATSPLESARVLSAVILALTLTRAPLVVTTIALQSYLIVYFRDRAQSWPSLVRIMGVLLALAASLALLAWWVGADVIVAVVGEVFRIDAEFLALLVMSSVPTAWVVVSGTAVLARSAHTWYSAGWVIAAVAAVLLLLVPGDIYSRSLLALSVGPLAGLLVHLFALAVTPQRERGD